jgi:hypothetical protein
MAKLNIRILRKEIADGIVKSSRVKSEARSRAQAVVETEKNKFLTEFENHKVSKEIAGGPSDPGGILPKGNLFSFIGFTEGRTPVEEAKEYFNQNIRLEPTAPVVKRGPIRILLSYFVKTPKIQEINNEPELQMPQWDTGAWLLKIENGISGLTHYLFKLSGFGPNSESGTGLQSKNIVRGILYKPRGYITPLLAKFRAKISGKIR